MTDLAATLMSIAMVAAFVMLGFGTRFALREDTRKQGRLMIVVGLILIANVLIWTV